jgi:diacylglycerol O-acyltransferase
MADEMRFEDRMSDADALMWNIEKDPALRSTITSVIVLDRALPHNVLTQRFERLTRVIPRLRQRVRSNPLSVAPPRWETDPNFDLSFHLWWVRCPGKGTDRELLSIAEPIAMSGFDRARPLWRAVIVEGLAGGHSAIIMKLHHAITDGVGGMKLQLELLDFDRDASERAMPERPTVHVMGQRERFVDAARHEQRRQLGGIGGVIRDPAGALSSSTELAASVGRVLRPVSYPLSPLMTGRSLSSRFNTLTIPLDALKKSAKQANGKLNDAFVAGVVRGLRIYHDHHGVECDELRMAIPISVRTPELADTAGNAFVPARIEIPIDIADPIELMTAIRSQVQDARLEPANDLVDPLSNILNRLPTSAVTALFGTMVKAVDFTTSNVPGAPVPLYLAGATILRQFPFGPLAGAALNITLLSYQNDLNIGVSSDPEAVPDAELLMDCLRQGFTEILDVA